MSIETIDTELHFVFEMFRNTKHDELNYVYCGAFTESITDSILALCETSLENLASPSKTKRRVYLVMVEGLQNITKHQEHGFDESQQKGFFVIQYRNSNFYITTSNLVHNSHINQLKEHIDRINGLDSSSLKSLYKEILENGEISNKGGAGLGLVDMARRAESKLIIDFIPYRDDFSYFYLQIEIKVGDNLDSSPFQIQQINVLNQRLSNNRISLLFNSLFNQESLLYLLSIIEKQLSNNLIFRRKVYNTMVEMLQNVLHHGINIDKEDTSIPGIFFIAEEEHQYLLYAGNYIYTENSLSLKDSLDYVNSLNNNELEAYYNERLFNFEIDNPLEAGLGIIDIRLKSGGKIAYNFKPIDNNFTFFSMLVPIHRN